MCCGFVGHRLLVGLQSDPTGRTQWLLLLARTLMRLVLVLCLWRWAWMVLPIWGKLIWEPTLAINTCLLLLRKCSAASLLVSSKCKLLITKKWNKNSYFSLFGLWSQVNVDFMELMGGKEWVRWSWRIFFMDQSLCLLMKIKTVTGCSLEMSLGSKLLLNSISISLSVKKMVHLWVVCYYLQDIYWIM